MSTTSRSPSRRFRFVPVAVLLGPALAVAAHALTVISACGEAVRGVAELRADLDCTAAGPEYALILASGATLRLNGFALVAPHNGVRCDGTCRLQGPGTIAASALGPDHGCIADLGVSGSARITDVRLAQWGNAALGDRLRAKGVTVENGCNGLGGTRTIRVSDSTLQGLNGAGVYGASVRVSTSTITNGIGGGIVGESLRVKTSTVTGNLVDLSSPNRPRVRSTICSTSSVIYPLQQGVDYWNVCEAPITTTTTVTSCPATSTIPQCTNSFCSAGSQCAPGQSCQLVGRRADASGPRCRAATSRPPRPATCVATGTARPGCNALPCRSRAPASGRADAPLLQRVR